MKIQPDKPEPRETAMASTKGDLRRLKQNSSATVAELKAFLAELKGKSPQEMLGIVASSQLFRAITTSTVVVFIGIIAFTAIPYAMGEKEEPVVEEETTTVEPKKEPAPAEPAPAEPAPPPAEADLSKLGVDETKEAPADKNPLETDNDNFLDGLD
ncbi:hypothetical protein HAHE_31830 [Haloferula helveola]|uniref:Preprotein translocase subunit SecG n=1 Tax=Haloferula helveola TaxID=490095 RepID=A0ABM7RGH8_9BACT|nr:hypothetical protein HAHE_31830 [Haloferula helveola]